LVHIRASGVNPLDIKIRAGKADHARQPLPAVLGLDMAGVVEEIGAGVFTLLPLLTGKYRAHHGSILAKAAALADSGKLRPLLSSQHFSTERLEDAYALVESGSLGKLVIDI
jgi:NADPH:quinone reductase-like Zn-dependent oxidoreductase